MRLILLFLLFPLFVQAQQIQQLTKNNHWDAGVDMYKSKVVWSSGKIEQFGKEYAEIFLAEGDRIQQITNTGLLNLQPRIGSKYIVWAQFERNEKGQTGRQFLMYFDGIHTFCLDTFQGNLYYNTVGKYIFWMDDAQEPDRYYIFNGKKKNEFTDAIGKAAIAGYMTEAGIFYTFWNNGVNYLALYNNEEKHEIIDSSKEQIFYRGNFHNYSYHLDGTGSKENGKTIFYSLCSSSNAECSTYFLLNGVKQEIPKINDTLRTAQNYIIYYGSDFLVFHYRDMNGPKENLKIIVWRNGKYFEVSEFPFTNINIYPELSDITFAFRFFEMPNRSNIGIYSKGKIFKAAAMKYSDEAMPNQYGVVWASSNNYVDYKQTSEVFYFCANDSCITAKPTENFSLKIFHRDNAKQIAIEVETPQAENFVVGVYDLLGREITTANFSGLYGKNMYTISSMLFTQGIYIVRLQNPSKPEQHLTQKIFIPN